MLMFAISLCFSFAKVTVLSMSLKSLFHEVNALLMCGIQFETVAVASFVFSSGDVYMQVKYCAPKVIKTVFWCYCRMFTI